MTAPKLVTPPSTPRLRKIEHSLAADQGWELLGWIGIAFALIGAVDLTLAVFPTRFGAAEWEFGTISAVLNGLPLPTLGLMFVLAAGIAQHSRWRVALVCVASILLVLALIGAAFLYVTIVPLALRDVTNPVVRLGLMKSVAKSGALLLIYPTVLTFLAYRGFRLYRTS